VRFVRIFPVQRRLPMIFQAEAAECGVACLAMVAGFYGTACDMTTLRRQMPISLRGSTLGQLLQFSSKLNLTGRPLRLELEDLPWLAAPCILHWDMNHFVVLQRATRKAVFMHDPQLGKRRLTYAEVSRHFTGVALELTPTAAFRPQRDARPLRLKDLLGRITGLRRMLAQIFVLAALLEVLSLMSPLFLQFAVDKVIGARHAALLVTLGLGFGLLVVLQTILSALRSWSTLYFGTSLKLQWNANIFSHLLRLPIPFFEKRYFGDILSRFHGADVIQQTVTGSFIDALLDGIISISVLAVMFFYSVILALVVIATVALYLVLRNAAYAPFRAYTEQQIVSMARQQSFFIETLRGIRTIKVFGRDRSRNSRWMNLVVATTNAQVAAEKYGILFRSANTLLFGLQSVAIVWLGARLVIDRAFTVGMLFAFVAYQEQFKARVATLVDRMFDFRMLSLQAHRLADVVLEKPEPEPPALLPRSHTGGAVDIHSLFFRYSDEDEWLLRAIDLHVAAGECLGISGRSGVGKSTLLKLMAGLLQPQQGEVQIDGHPAYASRSASPGAIGFVFQDDCLFSGTIAENISFCADEPDLSRVEECARLACLDEDIAAMPMGYNTLIGEMGATLSGGQQQRLLLARALYSRPSILILDEATSHLDLDTERRIAAMLNQMKVTRIFAAHRPETLAIADRIFHLDARAPAHRPHRRNPESVLREQDTDKFGPREDPKIHQGVTYAEK
jgi:ATP-binding cassette subfamily B protein RaxB